MMLAIFVIDKVLIRLLNIVDDLNLVNVYRYVYALRNTSQNLNEFYM